jgi:hypothetical protein
MNRSSPPIGDITMKRIHKLLGTALLALVPSTGALASSHSEAPAINEDPTADNTDLYAWVAPGTRDKLFLVANYIPLEEPSGGPNWKTFSDEVRYEIHVTRGRSLDDHVVYRVEFNSTGFPEGSQNDPNASVIGNGLNFFSQIAGNVQTATIRRIAANGQVTTLASGVPVAPINIGPRTDAVVNGGAYDDAFAATFIRDLSNGGRAFLGPRDDAFYVDLGGVFDLANLRGPGDGDGIVEPTEAQDNVAGYNTHTIALEIPIGDIFGAQAPVAGDVDDVLGVWASASRRKITVLKNNGQKETAGPFVQVSRLGLPLVNEAVIGLQNKDRWNASRPAQEVQRFGGYFLNPTIVRSAQAVGIYAALGVPDATVDVLKQNRTDILGIISLGLQGEAGFVIGDVLRIDAAVDSVFPNGRSLQGGSQPNREQVDVTDVLLNVFLAGDTGAAFGITDSANENDKDLLTTFPFLALPHQSFAEGHGRVTNP